MGFLGQEFDVNKDLPAGESNFEPIPAGWYRAKINSAELRDTKSGTGKYINVRYDIVGPTHAGRVVFGMINIRNQNPKAEEIGRQNFGDLCRAIGIPRVSDTDQLVGGDCEIKVSIRKSEEYGDKNEVRGWKSPNAAPIPKPAGGAPSTAAATSSPPWAKKAEPEPAEAESEPEIY